MRERWFEIEAPKPGIRSVIVGADTLGFKIDIHGDDPAERFDGGDTIQDRVGDVISVLDKYVTSDSRWVDYETREPVHVWDALSALSALER